jgi:hypothetical protein
VAHATRHIALIGDSHTFHWRAALNVVLQAQSWDGYVLTDSGCFFNEEVGGFSQGCLDWYHRAQAWIRDHPEVDTIFLTSNADTPLPPRAGQTYEQVKTDGFRRALLALPSTVKHVIVLRDLTRAAPGTFGCIAAAIAAGTSRLAPLCPVPRSVALREDLAVAAVKSLHDPRFEYIDLSRYVCSAVNCYPVVGGAQVNADIYGHLLTPFMRTLGPYLLRELRRREASW